MRYVCLNCGNRWDLEEGKEDKKVRCPSCMRVTGIEKLADAKPSVGSPTHSPWLVPGLAAVLLAAAAGGYAIWRASAPAEVGEEVPEAPLDHDVLLGHLRRLRVDARGVSRLLEPDEAIEALAEDATEGRSSATEIAEGIQAWMRERAAQHAFVRWSLGVPREAQVADARTVRSWIREDGERKRLYPLEAAALMVAALRSRGVTAMIAEAWEFPGDRSPPDPSGHFGYFVVAVFEGDSAEAAPAALYDPWGGHEVAPEEGSYRVLTDVQAIGAALNLLALHRLVRENDPSRAMELSAEAIRLDGRSPAARSVRGAILIAAGGAQDGVAEFEAAVQLRSDAPRHQLLGGVRLAQGDLEAARRELTAALEESPDYANAHAALAAVHLQQGEAELAREALETAQRIDPDLHTLPGLWAGFYASIGELDRAVAQANVAIERNPSDVQTHMMAAQVFRQAGRYPAMRREAQRIMELVAAGQREQMSQVIRRILGPTALEQDEEEISEDELLELDEGEEEEEEEGASGSGEFQLGGGSRLLGGADSTAPSLLEGERDLAPSRAAGAGEEPLLMLGDPSRLRLGGGGGDDSLRLDLEE